MNTTAVMRPASASALDYYLLRSDGAHGQPAGLLVEEFVLTDDLRADRLRGAGWTPADGGWWSSAGFARAIRADPRVRARLTATDRATARETYRRLGGGTLPDEPALRGRFHDDLPLAAAAPPLSLNGGPPVHRVLFAGDLDDRQAARLGGLLRMNRAAGPDGADPGVVSTGRLRVNDSTFGWQLRRVAGGLAWCIDVTSEPGDQEALRWLLRQLVGVARGHGLVPATIDRLS
ncbi:hypothetical protein AB0H57_15595 [Micromonospora sp. NPDC050686]|uniref:hypothetical protein n=1 Tax=Micromonospora sp. NPDC050686 TaxID=3154631 RepID=UPI0033C7F899